MESNTPLEQMASSVVHRVAALVVEADPLDPGPRLLHAACP